MSTVVPSKGHRYTRSAAMPSTTTSSQNPQNPHHLNSQAHALNAQSDMKYSVQPTTPPRTPRRDDQLQPSSQINSALPETGSKQRLRNKRPKNVMTSPAVIRNGRNSPPLTGAQSSGIPSSAKPISTPSTAAYAGPTFHASPAPSALPIPSFYSKSVPESPGVTELKNREASLSQSPTPTPPSGLQSRFPREESPLDFFFKADREEKARARSASSTQTGPFQPPSKSPLSSKTPPITTHQNRPRNTNRNSSSGMFAMELEGEGPLNIPYGPAFSTPYSERINAARSVGSMGRPTRETQQTMTSEALKAYLFSGHQSPSPSTPSSILSDGASVPLTPASAAQGTTSAAVNGLRQASPYRTQSKVLSDYDAKPPNQIPKSSGRSSGLRQEVTPTRTPTKTPDRPSNHATSPTHSQINKNSTDQSLPGRFDPYVTNLRPTAQGIPSQNRNADLKGMEDSLRKILKLDSSSSHSVTASSIGNLPAATTSVPNYVGGRPPPLNGMHNGVMGS